MRVLSAGEIRFGKRLIRNGTKGQANLGKERSCSYFGIGGKSEGWSHWGMSQETGVLWK